MGFIIRRFLWDIPILILLMCVFGVLFTGSCKDPFTLMVVPGSTCRVLVVSLQRHCAGFSLRIPSLSSQSKEAFLFIIDPYDGNLA